MAKEHAVIVTVADDAQAVAEYFEKRFGKDSVATGRAVNACAMFLATVIEEQENPHDSFMHVEGLIHEARKVYREFLTEHGHD